MPQTMTEQKIRLLCTWADTVTPRRVINLGWFGFFALPTFFPTTQIVFNLIFKTSHHRAKFLKMCPHSSSWFAKENKQKKAPQMTSDPGSGYHNHWSETNCASLRTTTEQVSVSDSANDHFQGLGTDRKGLYLKFPKSLLNHILSRGSH